MASSPFLANGQRFVLDPLNGGELRAAISYIIVSAILATGGASLRAQDRDQTMPVHDPAVHDVQHMHDMNMETTKSALPSPHAGSGTAWEPASVPAHFWMTSREKWDLMAHG